MPYFCPLNKPNLYESLALRKATGPAIRPGGLSVLEEVLERYPFNEGARVLDVGCGMGTSVAWLRSRCGLRASGMDLSRALLSVGPQHEPRLPLVQAMAERVSLADNCGDRRYQRILC